MWNCGLQYVPKRHLQPPDLPKPPATRTLRSKHRAPGAGQSPGSSRSPSLKGVPSTGSLPRVPSLESQASPPYPQIVRHPLHRRISPYRFILLGHLTLSCYTVDLDHHCQACSCSNRGGRRHVSLSMPAFAASQRLPMRNDCHQEHQQGPATRRIASGLLIVSSLCAGAAARMAQSSPCTSHGCSFPTSGSTHPSVPPPRRKSPSKCLCSERRRAKLPCPPLSTRRPTSTCARQIWCPGGSFFRACSEPAAHAALPKNNPANPQWHTLSVRGAQTERA